MNTTPQPSCEERIGSHLESRLEGMREGQKVFEEADDQSWYDHILSVDKTVRYRVCLSWGGPADYFDLTYQDGELDTIEYVFQDWYDGATRNLTGEDYELVKDMLEQLCEGE